MKSSMNVAIVGATGVVGSTILSILEERHFPLNHLYVLASQRSIGNTIEFKGKTYPVEDVARFDFSQVQISFFCASSHIAAEYAPQAAEKGCLVIDKSSYFRMDDQVPLMVPEVNGALLEQAHFKKIIASPNCTTIPIVMVLKPIYDAVGITRIHIATYQAVSGSGKEGITELADQTAQLLNGKSIERHVYPYQIAFNVLPQIDDMLENGYTQEEMKMVNEIKKILADSSIKISPTAVRVPVFYGHSAAVYIETREPLSVQHAIELLQATAGVDVWPDKQAYPTPTVHAAGKDRVLVGRLRADQAYTNGLACWIVCDNVRKGAALNAVHIAELFLKTT